MYQGIIGILGSVCIVMIWVHIFQIPSKFHAKTGKKLIKPFSCGFCLSFWVCLIFLMVQTKFIEAIFISSISPFAYLYVEDLITSKWEL